jgi:phosphate uptake regulator
MLHELIIILRGDEPLAALGEDFAEMLRRSCELIHEASQVFFGPRADPADLSHIAKQDVKVNRLQRKIRKRVLSHLSAAGNSADLPYCLLLMSLVKDVERIGDYAKDLCEARRLGSDSSVENQCGEELRRIAAVLESELQAVTEAFTSSDRERTVLLIRQGRNLVDRCDALLRRLARERFNPSSHAALVLGTQYYKRIAGHALNVLSGVAVPLHKLDYHDEKDLLPAAD